MTKKMAVPQADLKVAGILLRAQGVLTLMTNATREVSVDEPMPEGLQTSIMVVADLVDEALAQAGWDTRKQVENAARPRWRRSSAAGSWTSTTMMIRRSIP